MVAAVHGVTDLVEFLVGCGADVRARNAVRAGEAGLVTCYWQA